MTIKCSVYIATSLDGFIARKNGSIDWLIGVNDPTSTEDYGYKVFFDSVDTLVIGRNTYELVLTFGEWPYAGKNVVVLSTGSPKVPEHLAGSVEVTSLAPAELVKQLAAKGAQYLYVDGGKTIQSFLSAGLIDELTITLTPILIGEGLPLFGPLNQDLKLRHIETKAYPNGFVQNKYQLVRIA